MIRLTRRYRFPAAHVLRSPQLSEQENRRLYGPCANPSGHGHDYGVELTVTGPVDEKTGRIVERELLDRIVAERVLDRFGHRPLNEDPLFAADVPTAENVVLAIRRELEDPIARVTGARLLGVRLTETRNNACEVGER